MKRLSKDHRIDCYGAKAYVPFQVIPGEVFVVETYNALADLEGWKRARQQSEKAMIPNITGPIHVEGAAPGTVLRVDILDLELASDEGIIVALPGKGGLKPGLTQLETKRVRIDRHFVHFSPEIKIPCSPMIGKIGVAPLEGEIPSSLPGPHGGNMDNKQIRKGSSVLLPVFVEGAQLALGDAHAVMGDGESAHSGVETEVVTTLRCDVITRFKLNRPMVVTDSEVMTIAEGTTLDEASERALSEMAGLVMDRLHMTFGESAMLISVIGDLRVCQVINPLVTVRLALPRYILPLL